MRAAVDLVAGQLQNTIVILFKQHLLEFARTLRVAALAEQGGRRVLLHGLGRHGGSQFRFRMQRTGRVRMCVQFIHQQFQVCGSCPAASAHNRYMMFGHEFIKVIRKRFRLQRVHCLPIHVQGKPRIGDARNGKRGIFAQDADRLTHVLRAGGTIEANDINAHAFQDGQRGSHIRAKQHATGGI